MTIEYILSRKFKGVVVDSNLLILLLIGLFDPDEIEKNKRLNNYKKEDFDKLMSLIAAVSNKVIITPNTLTEVCNLTEKYNNETGLNFFKFLEERIKLFEEQNITSNEVINSNQIAFYKFGISDSSIANLAKEKYLIITADLPLYDFLYTQNLDVLNYTHLRVL